MQQPRQVASPSIVPEFPTLPKGEDFSTSFGAGVLAGYIESFWRGRGYSAVKVERYEVGDGAWGVRSNLYNGLPPRRQGIRKAVLV